MRETKFIEQNKEKWKKFEQISNNTSDEQVDELSNLYTEITDDLSYSRTYYKNRSVTVYLNNLSQELFNSIYSKRRKRENLLVRFFREDLPRTMYNNRMSVFIAFAVFTAAVLVGIISTKADPNFAVDYFGQGYIDMTKENIAKGEPMGVYQDEDAHGMFSHIFLNNLRVAFYTFIQGIYAALGSIIILIQNGVMLGTFKTFLYQEGVIREAFFAVWMHGTIEILSIILAGAAGITFGKGLLFPGTYTRLQSFRYSAQNGLKMFLGISPLILIAALIESYLTRYTQIPDFLRGAFIVLCFIFMIYYFVIFPFIKYRNTDKKLRSNDQIKKLKFEEFDPKKMYNIIDIFTLSLMKTLKSFKYIFILAILSIITLYYSSEYLDIKFSNIKYELNKGFLFVKIWLEISNIYIYAGFTLILSIIHQIIHLNVKGNKFDFRSYIQTLIIYSILLAPALSNIIWIWIILLALPLFIVINSILLIEKMNLFKAIKKAWRINISSYFYDMTLIGMAFLVLFLFAFIYTDTFIGGAGLIQHAIAYFVELLGFSYRTNQIISGYVNISILLLGFIMSYAFVINIFYLRYFTLKEKNDADVLFKDIEDIQLKTRVFGIEKD